ncbi:histidine kinase [Clostridium sp. SYSU_GA19001]|uniref:sensor histidine kinase n=1 Tax=Clostridium caldaquaticum TaxID=2940653 RepID=UPI0020770A14|nr:histidine kinase [Clostridium caldaquaticum]MCM8709983.1 histidine kinase [Clostridium caldaquaticum]
MKNKKKRKKFFKKALIINVSVIFSSIILTLLVNVLNIYTAKKSVIVTAVVIEIIVLIFMAQHFIRYIYIPIMNIDSALQFLEETQDELSFNLQDDTASITYTLNRMITLLKESMEREHALEILRKQAEISKLQSQINPHFLYNTLEAIRGEAIIQKNHEIAEMTEALANYFRYSISKKGDFVTLSDELRNVENYITIQKYRFDNRISFRIEYHSEESSVRHCLMPKLTLQPIIENSIYHGLETKIGSGEVVIHITATEKRLIITVSDNGVGIDSETLEKINERLNSDKITVDEKEKKNNLGIAITNINQRLKLLWGSEYGITISSTLNLGTEVEVTLPLINDYSLIKGDKV